MVTAAGTAEVTRRHAEVLRILLENRTSEPAVEAAAATAVDRYRERLAGIAGRLLAIGALRPGLGADRAAQILRFYFGAPAWATIRELGWDRAEAADWLHTQAAAALLAGPAAVPDQRHGGSPPASP